jgi:hypothetical protein
MLGIFLILRFVKKLIVLHLLNCTSYHFLFIYFLYDFIQKKATAFKKVIVY